MAMRRTAAIIHKQFSSIISDMEKNVDLYVNRPGKDFSRERICTFHDTIFNIMTMESHSLNRELFEYYRLKGTLPPTKSAFIQNRSKLKTEAFLHLFKQFNNRIPFNNTYHGLHLIGCDGTDSNIPANKNDEESFISYNSNNGGYYQYHTVVMYALLDKIYTDVEIQPRGKMNEADACCKMIDRNPISGKCLFVADRGFFSFNVLAHIYENNQFFLIRLKDIQSPSSPFKAVNLPNADEFDQFIEFVLTRRNNKEVQQHPERYKHLRTNRSFDYIALDDKESTYTLSFRLVKIKIAEDSYEYLITNLSQDRFGLKELKELYNLRWRIEVSFLFLKYGIAMNYFHSVIREHIQQEIIAKLILSNFVSLIISCVEVPQNSTKYIYQISVSDAIYKCRLYLLHGVTDKEICSLLLRDKTPIRPNRKNKRKMRSQALNSFQNRT